MRVIGLGLTALVTAVFLMPVPATAEPGGCGNTPADYVGGGTEFSGRAASGPFRYPAKVRFDNDHEVSAELLGHRGGTTYSVTPGQDGGTVSAEFHGLTIISTGLECFPGTTVRSISGEIRDGSSVRGTFTISRDQP